MARKTYPSDQVDKLLLRFPEGMRDLIAQKARESGRSMNAEIIHRLANSLKNPTFSDLALGLGDEELDWELMNLAAENGRSLKDELIYRLKLSLHAPGFAIVHKLEGMAHSAMRRYEQLAELLAQLTPGERRRLEERAEIAQHARKKYFSARQIDSFVKLNPVINMDRFYMKFPRSNDAPLFENSDEHNSSPKWHIKLPDGSKHELKYCLVRYRICFDEDLVTERRVKQAIIDGQDAVLADVFQNSTQGIFLEDPEGTMHHVKISLENGEWRATFLPT